MRDFRFWPEGWREIDHEVERVEECALLEDGIRRALADRGATHVLSGRVIDAIARHDKTDTVLFQLEDGKVAEVQSAWGPVAVFEKLWAWVDAVQATRSGSTESKS